MEIERGVMVEADEMDLIAFYLESSFCMPHLEAEPNGFSIYGWSDRFARTYDENGLRAHDAPRLRRSPFWEGLIATVERRALPGWTRIGCRLSGLAVRDQWRILKVRNEAARKARRLKEGQSVITGVHDLSESVRTALAISVGKSVSRYGIEVHAQEAATRIAAMAGVTDPLVLCWDVNDAPADVRFAATFKEAGTKRVE